MANTIKEFTIDDIRYTCSTFNTFEQLRIVKLLSPLLSSLFAAQNVSEEQATRILMYELNSMETAKLEELILLVLSHVRKNNAQENGKPNFVALASANALNFDDIPLEEVVKICYFAIKEHMASFFGKNSTLAKSVLSGMEKSN